MVSVRFKILTAVTFGRLRYVVRYKFTVSKEPLPQSSGQKSPISVQGIRGGGYMRVGPNARMIPFRSIRVFLQLLAAFRSCMPSKDIN